jgi:hypothetical protein
MGEIIKMKLLEKIDYITEEKVSSKAKRTLISLIKKPEKANIDVNGMKITSKPSKDGIIFTFPSDDFEVSMVLTDIVDTIGGHKFISKADKHYMTFEVIPK